MKKLLHGEVVVSPNPKIISSIIKQSEYLDEELLTKANNKFYTPDEFNNALQNLNMASQLFSMHLNISSQGFFQALCYTTVFAFQIEFVKGQRHFSHSRHEEISRGSGEYCKPPSRFRAEPW